jgi:uncharacterized protein YjeT (DUF2065 family)
LSLGASDVAVALALVLVLEGMLPFLAPSAWRNAFKKLVKMSDGQLRFFGLTSMIVGLIALLILP